MNKTLPQVCKRCRKLKMPELGTFRKVRDRAHDWYWVCHACEVPHERKAKAPGRDRAASPLERDACSALAGCGVAFVREFEVEGRWFDFAVPSLALLIECDSTRFHRFPSQLRKDAAKDALAERLGWRLVRVRLPDIAGQVRAAVDLRSGEVR